jgi:hypothetical protein
VTVLLDGVPLTSAASGVVDLADVPAAAVEAIELYRGGAPVSFASPTPGGLVNLVTRGDHDVRSVRVAGGSWSTGEATGDLGARHGAWSALVHGGWQGSDGNFRYRDDNGTPQNPDDDTIARRSNARFDAATALARLTWAPRGPVRGALHGEWFQRMQGVPGAGSVPAHEAHFASDRTTFAGELHGALGAMSPRGPCARARRIAARDCGTDSANSATAVSTPMSASAIDSCRSSSRCPPPGAVCPRRWAVAGAPSAPIRRRPRRASSIRRPRAAMRARRGSHSISVSATACCCMRRVVGTSRPSR